MLKIKDNVDLKDLEKFGFKYKEEANRCPEAYEKNTEKGETEVFIWDREIFCQDLDVLWDLIQANLVEKAEK
jgi:hypothetical protein